MALVAPAVEKEAAHMKQHPKVAVVILNWNGRFFLEKFLPYVYNSTYPNIEFVVGDNASSDDSVAFVRADYPTIRVITNQQNLGFAGGYNEVLKQVDADYFVLLNSDVEVTPDWIQPVIELLESQPDMAAAQPKIRSLHQRDHFEHAGAAGGYLDSYGFPFCRGRILHAIEQDNGQYDDIREVFWVSGAALFIKRTCWEVVGGFDDDFFAHMEEVDLAWRLKLMGYRMGYCPKSVVFHVGGGTLSASNPQKTFLNFRNSLFLLQKNLPFFKAAWIIFARMWIDLVALFHFLSLGKFSDAWAISRAHQQFFANFAKTAKKRRKYAAVFQHAGHYRGSVVWAFYVHGKTMFSKLNPRRFL
ncbi:glycosyltransferase family 2 protein [Parapedobacter lycopersici]|uniref:glycosyltransferase family 2 protein n=1 Tax=Parapedobacter lycopersici TaxID=1864939 RepID=UPI00214D759C|nr:glycosyltransferase family 2 protein [Parapedobacter lycopersici]